MPSSSVDLPEPFSPTRNVTPALSSRPSRSTCATAGTLAGHSPAGGCSRASTRRTGRASNATRPRRSGVGDVHQPGDAEPVLALAELVAPHLPLQREHDLAVGREPLPVAAQRFGVVPAEADGDVVARLELHRARDVRAHEGEAHRGLELAVHDVRGLRPGRWVTELPERADHELAAEDRAVEVQGLSRLATEVEVGVEARGHGVLLRSLAAVASTVTPHRASGNGGNAHPYTRRHAATGCCQPHRAGPPLA